MAEKRLCDRTPALVQEAKRQMATPSVRDRAAAEEKCKSCGKTANPQFPGRCEDCYTVLLLDNLACASQERRFLDDGDLRTLVRLNVINPLLNALGAKND